MSETYQEFNELHDLMRRFESLEKQVNHLEAHLNGHEKNVHEGIREYLADLNSGQRNIRDEIAQLRKWTYRRFTEITSAETTENIARRDVMGDVWRTYDTYRANGHVLQATYFLYGAAKATDTTIFRLLEDRHASEGVRGDEG